MCPEFTLQTSNILPSKLSQLGSSSSALLPSPSLPYKWIQMVIPILGRMCWGRGSYEPYQSFPELCYRSFFQDPAVILGLEGSVSL